MIGARTWPNLWSRSVLFLLFIMSESPKWFCSEKKINQASTLAISCEAEIFQFTSELDEKKRFKLSDVILLFLTFYRCRILRGTSFPDRDWHFVGQNWNVKLWTTENDSYLQNYVIWRKTITLNCSYLQTLVAHFAWIKWWFRYDDLVWNSPDDLTQICQER